MDINGHLTTQLCFFFQSFLSFQWLEMQNWDSNKDWKILQVSGVDEGAEPLSVNLIVRNWTQ